MTRPFALPVVPVLTALIVVGGLAGCIEGDGAPDAAQCPSVPADAGTVLHGEVYRSDGGSTRGAYVEARGPYGVVLHTATKSTACFAFRVNPGNWTVVASQSGWAGSTAAAVGPGETVGLVIVMQRV